MAEQNPPRNLAFPAEEIKKIYEDVSSARGMAASCIKLYAGEVGLESWEGSPMPLLIDVYSFSNQLASFLDKKILEPTEEEVMYSAQYDGAVPAFTPEEVIMMSNVVNMITKTKKTLASIYNISFEVH